MISVIWVIELASKDGLAPLFLFNLGG